MVATTHLQQISYRVPSLERRDFKAFFIGCDVRQYLEMPSSSSSFRPLKFVAHGAKLLATTNVLEFLNRQALIGKRK